jgi:hypothetical protein
MVFPDWCMMKLVSVVGPDESDVVALFTTGMSTVVKNNVSLVLLKYK